MKTDGKTRFFLPIVIFTVCILASCSHTKVAVPVPQPVQPKEEAVKADPKVFVENMLVSKGHKRMRVRSLLNDPRFAVNTGIITKNLFDSTPKASAKNPEVMEVDPKFYPRGVAFIEENHEAFKVAWEKYEISPELITAILILETRLGNYPMRYNVFQVYAALTTLLDAEYLESVLQSKGGTYKLNDEALKTARAKGKWGLEELSAFLQLTDGLGIDPIGIKGSFAGALGPAQFIPSSFVKYGADGDNDGKRDPFSMNDCIASIANYMKLAGWKEDADLKRRRQAIWIYNHHDIYVNTILMIYNNLIIEGEKYKGEGGQAQDNTGAAGRTEPDRTAAPADKAANKGVIPADKAPDTSKTSLPVISDPAPVKTPVNP